ncbi:MAG: DUF4012 domain-containing protein [Candidatus Magasanikbacteria bacterium]|nr:DUF4012 domain-containing protein [Candidatus Magasanikbacteria bacterium]
MPRVRRNKIKRRSCTGCKKMGHNSRTCPEKVIAEELDIEVGEVFVGDDFIETKIETTKKYPKVVVCGEEKMMRSPHIVNLRGELKKQPAKVEVYKEKENIQNTVGVNFANLVRKANQRRKVELDNKNISSNFILKEELNRGRIEKIDVQKIKKAQSLKKKEKIKIEKTEKQNKVKNEFSFFTGISSKIKLFKTKINFSLSRLSFKKWVGNFTWKKMAYQSVVMFLLVAIPIPTVGYFKQVRTTSEQIVEGSKQALVGLHSSTLLALNSDISGAQTDLNNTLEYFNNTKKLLDSENKILMSVLRVLPIFGKSMKSRESLLSAGQSMALANTYIVKGIGEATEDGLNATDKIALISEHLNSALPQYENAFRELSGVDPKIIPKEYRDEFKEFQILFGVFIEDLGDLVQLIDTLQLILGSDDFRRYLLVFQNNNELRPTGGFLGSFAIIDIQKGRIQNIDIPGGGSYDLKGQLDAYLTPPLPLQLVNSRWEFQDSNWFPDFGISAQKMAWFYEHSRGTTVDGVIAVNATVLERVLKVVGSITSEKHNLELMGDTAIDDLQYQVEINYDKIENKPKEVIGELVDDLFVQFEGLDNIDLVRVLNEFHQALKEKEVQAFFFDRKLQKTVRDFGWSGEISYTNKDQDYLNIVSANLQGQKSDKKIEQNIEHEVFIQKDGSIVDKVIIKKKHTGIDGEMFSGVRNISYVRAYVPEGSELLEAGGFSYPAEGAFHVSEDWYEEDLSIAQFEKEVGIHSKTGTRITKEFGKTVFGNWVSTDPGGESEIYFIYKLPFKIPTVQPREIKGENFWNSLLSNDENRLKYSLVLQKQSGINSGFSSSVKIPDDWDFIWKSDNSKLKFNNLLQYNSILQSDTVFGAVIEGEIN